MHFLLHILTISLSAYLAGVNALATPIETAFSTWLPPAYQRSALAPSAPSLSFRKVDSLYDETTPIPDILIKNAAFQQAAVVESIDPSLAPATAKESLVNIYCSYTSGNYTKTTTGTGFFIDTDGVILTNAHVAQFLLLEGIAGDAQCIIRTGNPATPMYKAELLYISPVWIKENAKLINDSAPKGTGERDYALLYVNEGLNNKPMPSKFAALPFDTSLMKLGAVDNSVFATGYPAESMLEEGIDSPLIPKQATTTISELMTFGSNLVDLFTIHGTSIGEHGSSGGPVVDAEGKAIGIISTKGDDAQFGKGSLRAISLSYIDRSIKEETGFPLVRNLGGDLPYRAALFKKTIIPFLQSALKDEL